MDVEEIISGLADLDRLQLARVEAALRRRMRALGEDAPIGETSEGHPVSGVVEYRPHADGTLQKEVRRYYRKDGTPKEQGPYWYFRYHEDGKQKKLYLGKTDDPVGELSRRRTAGIDTRLDGTRTL
jgi:hypothetical protein